MSQKKLYEGNQTSLRIVNFTVNKIEPFPDSTPSNFNFEPSLVGIRHILIEIWLVEHEIQNRDFGQLRILMGVKFANKLFMKLLYFILISN